MANYPLLPIERRRLPDVEIPQKNFASGIAAGLSDLGETIQKIQDQADEGEKARLVTEGRIKMEAKRQEAFDTIADPDEYARGALSGVQDARAEALKSASNSRVRRSAQPGLDLEVLKAQAEIAHQTVLKTGDKARGDFEIQKNNLLLEASTGDESTRERALNEFGGLVASMQHRLALKPEEGARELYKFAGAIDEATYTEDLKKDAYQAIDDMVAVRKYQSIRDPNTRELLAKQGERLIESRSRQDERLNKGIADVSLRAFRQRALNHELDEDRFREAASRYKWPDSTVDSIIRIQTGLRESSPNSEKLVSDALTAVSKTQPTLSDVREAERQLDDLARKVSASSTEYRDAIKYVRSIRNQVTQRVEIEEGKSWSRARTRVSDLFNQYAPDMFPEDRRQQQAAIYRRIDSLSPPEREKYVGDLEKRLMEKQKKEDGSQKAYDGLRSLNR